MTKFGETDQSAQVVRRHTFEERQKLLSGKALVDYADYLYTTGLNVRDFEEVFIYLLYRFSQGICLNQLFSSWTLNSGSGFQGHSMTVFRSCFSCM